MEKIKLYSKSISFITSGIMMVSLCGCSNRENSSNNSSSIVISEDDIVTSVPVSSSTLINSASTAVPDIVTSSTCVTSSNISELSTTSTTTDSLFSSTTVSDIDFSSSSIETTTLVSDTTQFIYDCYTDDDNLVLDYFHKLGDDIRDNIDTDLLLDKGKMYFVYSVDFLFYDGEIKGVRFDDLTDMAKQQLLNDVSTIDLLICSKFPNYKETISENGGYIYDKASEIIRMGSQNVMDFSRDKLGEDNYSKLREYKDMFIDQTVSDWSSFVDILGNGKSKFDDWYNGFKGQD